MAKRYRISPVDYENAGSVIKDKYHYQEIGEISNFMGDWFCYPLGFDEKKLSFGKGNTILKNSIQNYLPQQLFQPGRAPPFLNKILENGFRFRENYNPQNCSNPSER